MLMRDHTDPVKLSADLHESLRFPSHPGVDAHRAGL